VMEALHLSTALGAFVAGVMLADSPYRHELETDIEPFRSILLGLFFIAVGMMLNLNVVATSPLFVVGMALALVALKASVLFGIAKAFGTSNRRALKLGLLLSQGGEFAFVLFAAAQDSLLIAPEAASLFGAIVTVSMATTPFLMMLNEWIDRHTTPAPDNSHLDGPEKSHATRAIIIGYGRFGQAVSQMLIAKDISVTLIDVKPSQIEIAGDFDMKVYYGDGTRIDLLRTAGAADAEALLFCIDGATLTAKKLEPILEAFPQAAVFVRAFDRRQVMALADIDLAGIYREVFESAVCMGREALGKLGSSPEEVDRVERDYRERDITRLESQSASGDLHASKQLMYRPGDGQVEPKPETPG